MLFVIASNVIKNVQVMEQQGYQDASGGPMATVWLLES